MRGRAPVPGPFSSPGTLFLTLMSSFPSPTGRPTLPNCRKPPQARNAPRETLGVLPINRSAAEL